MREAQQAERGKLTSEDGDALLIWRISKGYVLVMLFVDSDLETLLMEPYRTVSIVNNSSLSMGPCFAPWQAESADPRLNFSP